MLLGNSEAMAHTSREPVDDSFIYENCNLPMESSQDHPSDPLPRPDCATRTQKSPVDTPTSIAPCPITPPKPVPMGECGYIDGEAPGDHNNDSKRDIKPTGIGSDQE